jgi:hypothetical protein
MKHLKTYQLFEAHGVAEATLIYNEFLLDEFNDNFDSFMKKDESVNKSKGRNYSNTINYKKEDLSMFIKNSLWPKFPVSTMEVTYNLEIMTDLEYAIKFPTAASSKLFIGTGACYNIEAEDGSSLQPAIDDRSDVTIHLKLEIGALITNSFSDRDGLSIEVESAITHELNHGYEGWNRMRKGKGQLSTDVTWALEVNRSRIKKDIWKTWYDEVGYYIYWSELHEMNAMVQDAWPYVKRYNIDELKEKTPSWRFAKRMIEFDGEIFKEVMTDKILSVYPDADVDLMLRRIKNGFANELIKRREESINSKEDKPTLSGEDIKAMSVDKFLNFIQKRINRSGSRIQKNITKLYSLKSNTKF